LHGSGAQVRSSAGKGTTKVASLLTLEHDGEQTENELLRWTQAVHLFRVEVRLPARSECGRGDLVMSRRLGLLQADPAQARIALFQG